ncbi:hypothetical protein CLV51_102820 [Chitinophaga niastensis]|uniref:Parallel beta helix pectate lyase-like protein n=1 Tax=Chitinophaga niastensis TaxID=536980 RepID=A0A2P8HP08_CHINA|nr:hypothetical protein [Chitinophaga niastensis]PSL47960.1 hypothetical protein CLV51_102820 [Chitinophaga niastensis]
MRKILIPAITILSALILITGCKKWAEDKTDIYKYTPAAGQPVSDATPLCGSIKGVMLAGKTYTIGCDVYVNKGDTLLIQQGVTINVTNGAGIAVRGILVSLGTKSQPVTMTVPGLVKDNTPGLAYAADSAHSSNRLWKGIACDTSCPMLVLKWTHIDFAGNSYGKSFGPAVQQKPGTSFNLVFQNPNGYFIMEDSWLWGGTDDAIRISSGKIHIFRNTFEKNGGSGGDIVNVKGGTTGTMAYNFFIGTAYNGQKASNKGQGIGAPQTNVVMYNSTFVNGGRGVVPGQRGSTVNFEEGARGAFYNNVAVNCRVGFRVVNNPAADTANLTYGNNYQYADSLVIANNFFTSGTVCTKPQPTDLPKPSTYLPANFNYTNPQYDGTPVVQKLNPLFVNYPLPSPYSPWGLTSIGNYNFHIQPGSPLVGKGYTGIRPFVVVPVDAVYGASEITPPSVDLGCFQSNGSGNQH